MGEVEQILGGDTGLELTDETYKTNDENTETHTHTQIDKFPKRRETKEVHF